MPGLGIALIANPGSGSADPEAVERELVTAGARVERFELDEAERAAASGAVRREYLSVDGS